MAAALALMVVPLVLSCAYATGKPRTVQGQDFPYGQVEQVHEGMPVEQVRELLGEPFEVEATPTGKRWRYYERERQDERIYVLGFIPINRPYWVVDTELVLDIEDGTVKTVSFQENRIK
jgi:outer membrane protein assembly factor BamE (lipoprotein component of BamABCDE complex)